MRCPDCNKFVGLELSDPEVEGIEISDDGTVTTSVRIVRTCSECSQELKEANLDLEAQVPEEKLEGHKGDGHELTAEEDGVEPIEEGGGRYAKAYFGAVVSFVVRCSCQKDGDDPIYSGSMRDKIAAGQMDELV